MTIIHGTYKGGHVELDSPVDWPEGVRVGILSPVPEEETSIVIDSEPLGMSDAEWPTTKEGIAALIAEWNAMEPLKLTPEDEKEIEAAQKWIDDYSRAAVAKDMGLTP